jgi:hypothetical protein
MGELARKALEAMDHRGKIDHDLIDSTLQEIGETYRPGLIGWLKKSPSRWERLLGIEGDINRMASAGDKQVLTAALSAYRSFFKEMVTAYQEAKDLPLFGGG